MKNRALNFSGAIVLIAFLLCAACGNKPAGNNSSAGNTSTTTNTTASTQNTASTASSGGGGASAAVKAIYDHAMKRNCAAIPPLLTEEFRKEVGTSQDSLDALCDSFTDSGRMTSYEIKGEEAGGDSVTVNTTLTYKDGKTDTKKEKMKKVDGKWLMEP